MSDIVSDLVTSAQYKYTLKLELLIVWNTSNPNKMLNFNFDLIYFLERYTVCNV